MIYSKLKVRFTFSHAGFIPYYIESANADLLMADLKDKFEKIPSLHPILQNYTESHVIPPFSLGPYQQVIESCFSRESLIEIRAALEQTARENSNREVPKYSMIIYCRFENGQKELFLKFSLKA